MKPRKTPEQKRRDAIELLIRITRSKRGRAHLISMLKKMRRVRKG